MIVKSQNTDYMKNIYKHRRAQLFINFFSLFLTYTNIYKVCLESYYVLTFLKWNLRIIFIPCRYLICDYNIHIKVFMNKFCHKNISYKYSKIGAYFTARLVECTGDVIILSLSHSCTCV